MIDICDWIFVVTYFLCLFWQDGKNWLILASQLLERQQPFCLWFMELKSRDFSKFQNKPWRYHNDSILWLFLIIIVWNYWNFNVIFFLFFVQAIEQTRARVALADKDPQGLANAAQDAAQHLGMLLKLEIFKHDI